MNWFPDMFWLFLEWWLWPLLGVLMGLAIGWLVWRSGWRRSEVESAREIGTLRETNASLNVDVGQLTMAANAGKSRSVALEGDLDALRAEAAVAADLRRRLEIRSDELDAVTADRNRVLARLDDYEATLESVIDVRSDLEKGLAAKESEVVNLIGERESSVQSLRAATTELEGLRNQSSVMEIDVTTARERVGELEMTLAERNATITSLQENLDAREQAVALLDAAIVERDGRLSDAESHIAEVSMTIAELESSTASSASEVVELRGLMGQRDSRDEQVNGRLLERNNRVADLERELGEGKARVETLDAEVSERTARMIRLHTMLGERDARITELEGSLEQQSRSFSSEQAPAPVAALTSERAVADDLQTIEGIDQPTSELLKANGFTSLRSIATMDDASISDLEARTELASGRIRQQNWVPQAAQLHFEVHDEDIYDLVTVEGTYADAFEQQLAEASRGRRLDYVDELQMISGVGPKMEKLLHTNGLKTFVQVSLLDDQGVAALNDRLAFFPGRIERDDWVGQAARLHAEHHPDS